MDPTKLRKLIDRYDARLRKVPETTETHKRLRRVKDMLATFKHLTDVLTHKRDKLDDEQKVRLCLKLNRWLGFIHAVLWDLNIYSIDDCRRHVREVYK